MYTILKKYMKEHFKLPYSESDKQFSVYLYYANIGTYIQHIIEADKNGFSCKSMLPFEMLFDGDYYPHQIDILSRINSNIEYGTVDVDEETKQLMFVTEYVPNIKFCDFTEHIFAENLTKMILYGCEIMDREYGELLSEYFRF